MGRVAYRKNMPNPTATVKTKKTNFMCYCCGNEYAPSQSMFYKNKNSPLFKANGEYTTICKTCIDKMFKQYQEQFQSEALAVIMVCHYLDIPFYYSVYDNIKIKYETFTFGYYIRYINTKQYADRTFINSLACPNDLFINAKQYQDAQESAWGVSDHRNARNVIEIVGSDPFADYKADDRRVLFNELIKYLDEDGIEDDHYKISQLIQLVNNNHQIREIDKALSKLNMHQDMDKITELSNYKKTLVANNDKIAKENEISVKNRSNKDAGRSTLTYLMKELRERDFTDAVANYYRNLQSENTRWAANISMQAIKSNCFFDEHDMSDILNQQRELIAKLESDNQQLFEEKRKLLIREEQLTEVLTENKIEVPSATSERDAELKLLQQELEAEREERRIYEEELREQAKRLNGAKTEATMGIPIKQETEEEDNEEA